MDEGSYSLSKVPTKHMTSLFPLMKAVDTHDIYDSYVGLYDMSIEKCLLEKIRICLFLMKIQ